MAASVGNDDGDIGFQIAPMVDVVFVLMLFFMASAGMQITELELNINLPGSGGQSTPGVAITPLVVDISPDGRVIVNDTERGTPEDKALDGLREFFKTVIVEADSKDPVIIRPHLDTRHERIMDVLNAAGAAGVKNLTFN